ncbi:MAG: acyltransferase [Pseudomonadota bacterium]|nr:acyltransferase [Pseudomonadota bacterium]
MSTLLSAFSPLRNLKLLFVRPASNFPVLDGFRALSMLMIMVFHTFSIYSVVHPDVELIDMVNASTWSAWVWNADKSVDIFFVISGFLITGILLRQIDKENRIRFGNFYFRRFLRLSPAYWLVLGLYAWMGYVAMDAEGREQLNLHNIWTNLLYINNFVPYDEQAMNWTWTLAIEEQFYLIYPLILLLLVKYTRRPLLGLWALIGVSFLVRFLVIITDEPIRTMSGSQVVIDQEFHAYHFSVLYDNLYTRFGALLCGCIAAFYYFHHEQALRNFLNSTWGKVCEFASFGIIVLLMWLPVVSTRMDDQQTLTILYQTFSRNLFSGAVAYLALVCLEKSYLSWFLNLLFSNRFWYPLAQLSYSMYLLHVFPILILVQMGVNAMQQYPERYDYTHWQAMSLICLYSTIITILGAVIIYLLIERPIMNLRK